MRPDARVGDEVAQGVEPVVATPVGDDQGALVAHDDETGPVTAGGLVETAVADRRDDDEGCGRDDAGVARQ